MSPAERGESKDVLAIASERNPAALLKRLGIPAEAFRSVVAPDAMIHVVITQVVARPVVRFSGA
jgi:hypothetical protein